MRVHQTDFSKGNVYRNIIEVSLPMTLAQLLNLLYNIVDRMYIGSRCDCTDWSGNLFSGDHNDCGIYISVWEWRQSALCNGTGTRKS